MSIIKRLKDLDEFVFSSYKAQESTIFMFTLNSWIDEDLRKDPIIRMFCDDKDILYELDAELNSVR